MCLAGSQEEPPSKKQARSSRFVDGTTCQLFIAYERDATSLRNLGIDVNCDVMEVEGGKE
jgi:hypothetical protein